MKYAICMLVHKNPDMLEQITKQLVDNKIEIIIHLDKKCNISDYDYIRNVTFIPERLKVYWGGRSMIKAMYNLIKYVLFNTDCDYLLFISGEDCPVVLPSKYNKYIQPEKNYFEYKKLPKNDWFANGMNRIMYYYLFSDPNSVLNKICISIQKLSGIHKKLHKLPFQIYGGSQWININRVSAEYIIKNWKYYYSFFKFCLIPDEMIFQTIVMNSELKDSVVNKNYRYLRYEKNSSNAAYLDSEEIDNVVKFKYLFCRKIKDIKLFDSLS